MFYNGKNGNFGILGGGGFKTLFLLTFSDPPTRKTLKNFT